MSFKQIDTLAERGVMGEGKMKKFLRDATLLVALMVAVGLFSSLAIGWVLSDPVVQKEAGTGRVVCVITSDGVRHSANFMKDYKGSYATEWVAPLAP